MKPILKRISLVFAALVCSAPSAWSQSSVQLYGRVITGAEYVNKVADDAGSNARSLKRLDEPWGTSILGFMGTEDLGDGLKANFVLENGFSSDTGTVGGDGFFNRRSYVGLSDPKLGSVRLGHNLLISNDVYYLDPTGQEYIGSASLVRGRSWQGARNVVEYTTPATLGAFAFSLQLGLGEQGNSNKALSTAGFSASYVRDDLELRAIYSQRYDADAAFTNVYTYSKESIVGGTYRVGPAKLFAAYDYITASGAPSTSASQLRHAWAGVRYDVAPAFTVFGAAYHVNTNRADGRATLVVAGTDYYLSKRTFLYATIGNVGNSSTANFAADATVNGPGFGASQRVVYAGFGHSF